MNLRSKTSPPAHRAAAAVKQDELRDRRRKRLPIHLGRKFDLSVDVGAICSPLAYGVSTLTRPAVARRDVDALADAVAEVVHLAAGLVAESRLADGQTRAAAVDLAVRPRQPVISDDQLASGSWAATLVAYAGTVSADLGRVLGGALPPDDPALRGQPSMSERIERALREVDAAALNLERRIPKIRARQELPSMSEFNQQQAERIQNERAARRREQIGA